MEYKFHGLKEYASLLWGNSIHGYEEVETEQPQPRETKVNYSTAVMLINPSIKAVTGRYEKDAPLEMFKTLDTTLKVDDLVVVESSTRWGVTTVKIVNVDVEPDFDSPKQVGWVIGKISTDEHEKIKSVEAAAIEVIKKSELRKRADVIRQNVLDAKASGELDALGMKSLGAPAIDKQGA